MRHWNKWLLPLLLLSLAGCGDGTGPDGPVSLTVLPPQGTLQALGDTLRLQAEVRDADGDIVADAQVEWQSLAPEVATVDTLGRVVARDVGDARIVAASGTLADTVAITVAAGVSEAQLSFVRLAAGAPPLTSVDTSFWAVRGQDRRLEIRVRSAGSDDDAEEFLQFRVREDALLRYPDGRAFATGDSVQIRVRVDDSGRFQFMFEPAGLRFDPERPAELRVRYAYAEPDALAREDDIFVWRQEQPGEPWVRIATARIKDGDEVRAEITGFTAFALALP